MWDAENRLIRSTVTFVPAPGFFTTDAMQQEYGSAAYTYDADGIRTSKTSIHGDVIDRVEYLTDKNQAFAQVVFERHSDGSGDVHYVYGHDLVRQRKVISGTPTPSYYHYDAQLSTRLVSDETGDLSGTYTYDAFGRTIGHTGADVPYRYTGEQFDPHAGGYYLRARYYSSTVGRFASQDTFNGNVRDPLTLHRYVYAGGNPIANWDPGGDVFGGLVGALQASLFSLSIRALDAAPKAAAFTWTVTKIAGLVFLLSSIAIELESEGWLPRSGVAEPIQAVSGAIFLIGFILTGAIQSLPSPRGELPYGSTALSRQAQYLRRVDDIKGARNVAVFEYRDASGQLLTIARVSRFGVGHAERIIGRELEQMGIQPSQVTRIYSELEPCEVAGGYCRRYLEEAFPQAVVSWSFEYGDAESRRRGVQALQDAVKLLFQY